MKSLFVVEYKDSGDLIDVTGEGGYSVWLTREEAQDALECEASNVPMPEEKLSVVEFRRVANA